MAVSNNRDFRGLCQKVPHVQSLKVAIEWGTIFKQLSYNFRHKNNIFSSEQPYKDIEIDL